MYIIHSTTDAHFLWQVDRSKFICVGSSSASVKTTLCHIKNKAVQSGTVLPGHDDDNDDDDVYSIDPGMENCFIARLPAE